MKQEFPTRKAIRLPDYDYSTPGAYFVTICTKDRKRCLWDGEIDPQTFHWNVVGANCVRPNNLPLSDRGKIVREELERWHGTYAAVSLCAYVIMPNHLHLMVMISSDECGRPQVAPTVSRMVKQFKGVVTKKLGQAIWQRSFMEHIIRDQTDYDTRIHYLYENPLRWNKDEFFCE